jgi:UPF0271 protein
VRIDLNADMGEAFGAYRMGADEELMPLVTSANVACGFHAGDPEVLDRTVALAARHGVAVGAHPGYPDLRGFGRRPLHATPREVEADVLYQIGAAAAFARAHGVRLVHVKPHGALYNQAAADEALARAIARAMARFDGSLVYVGLASSRTMREAARGEGLRFAGEAFADRAYNPDGTLVARSVPGSVIVEPERAALQALSIARDGVAVAHDGSRVSLRAETLCIHGDNPSALSNARGIRKALAEAAIEVAALGPVQAASR